MSTRYLIEGARAGAERQVLEIDEGGELRVASGTTLAEAVGQLATPFTAPARLVAELGEGTAGQPNLAQFAAAARYVLSKVTPGLTLFEGGDATLRGLMMALAHAHLNGTTPPTRYPFHYILEGSLSLDTFGLLLGDDDEPERACVFAEDPDALYDIYKDGLEPRDRFEYADVFGVLLKSEPAWAASFVGDLTGHSFVPELFAYREGEPAELDAEMAAHVAVFAGMWPFRVPIRPTHGRFDVPGGRGRCSLFPFDKAGEGWD